MPTDTMTADKLAMPAGISELQAAPLVPRPRQLSSLLNASKAEIRTSLKASTLDGMFATVFSTVTGGVLLTNFLLGLSASPTEIAMVASIPMVANLMQPIGAYISERTTSRHFYCLWVYGISRSLWLVLAISVLLGNLTPALLITLTLAVVTLSYFLGAFGSAPWLSWIAILVPRQLRGRYFGLRTSAANLTNLIAVPLTGWVVSKWHGGSIQGYGVVLILGVIFGLVSLWFQNFMIDINPQTGQRFVTKSPDVHPEVDSPTSQQFFQSFSWRQLWGDRNFLKFLLYFNFWTFAVNLSAPFFNVYMLDTLHLNINYVTFYNSLLAGANLLMLMIWGKLADRIGNRPILLGVGIIFALFPLFWLLTGATSLSTWFFLPLLHIIAGGTAAAIDLSTNNLQLGIAPKQNPSIYFGIAAAFAGISGALGATAGGFLIQFGSYTGLLGLFAISSLLRLSALLPLIFVNERPCAETLNPKYEAPAL